MIERHFHGFEPGEAEERLRKIVSAPVTTPPAIHNLRDAVALPGIPGLYDINGRRIDEAAVRTISADAPLVRRQKLHRTAEFVTVPNRLEVVEERVLFGGHLMNHYGLFIIESMSRLWARDLNADLPIVFTMHRTWAGFPSYAEDVFRALDLSSRSATVDRPTLFRDVLCPGTAFEYRWKAFSVAEEPHTAVAAALEGTGQRSWRRPVYLTRSGLPDDLRKNEAEPELEEEVERRGFEVVRAESLSLADQISLFEQVPLIVGTLGSAFHTALFSRSSGTQLGLLNWGRGFENYLLVDAVKRHRPHYLKAIHRRTEAGEEHVLEVGRALELLEAAGLLTPRTNIAV